MSIANLILLLTLSAQAQAQDPDAPGDPPPVVEPPPTEPVVCRRALHQYRHQCHHARMKAVKVAGLSDGGGFSYWQFGLKEANLITFLLLLVMGAGVAQEVASDSDTVI